MNEYFVAIMLWWNIVVQLKFKLQNSDLDEKKHTYSLCVYMFVCGRNKRQTGEGFMLPKTTCQLSAPPTNLSQL